MEKTRFPAMKSTKETKEILDKVIKENEELEKELEWFNCQLEAVIVAFRYLWWAEFNGEPPKIMHYTESPFDCIYREITEGEGTDDIVVFKGVGVDEKEKNNI